MRETCKPPITSLAGVPHDHTLPCHSPVRLRHSRNLPRHSRVGGNPRRCVHTPGWMALLPSSTEFDRIRQNPTETRVRAYPNSRACAREGKRDSRLRGNDVSGCGNDAGGCGNDGGGIVD